MSRLRFYIFFIFIICTINLAYGQMSRFVPKSKPKIALTERQILTRSLFNDYEGAYADDGLQMYLVAGANFSTQAINTNSFQSSLLYKISTNSNEVLQPGLVGGFSLDGTIKNKNKFSIVVTANKYLSGTSYSQTKDLHPLFGSYSSFEADKEFIAVQMEVLYKRSLLTFRKSHFNILLGPGIESRIDEKGQHYLINANYNPIFINGIAGVEIERTRKYKLFVHYKQSLQSITTPPINVQFNSLSAGLMFNPFKIF